MKQVKFTPVKLIIFFVAIVTLTPANPGKCFAFQNNINQELLTQGADTLLTGTAETEQNEKVPVTALSENADAAVRVEKEKLKAGESVDEFILHPLLKSPKMAALKSHLLNNVIKYIPREIRSFYTYVIELCFQYPVILFLVAFILFFIINIVIVFVVLNYTLKRKAYKNRYISVYGKMYEEVLLMYMFGTLDWEKTRLKLKKHQRKINRKILISILMNFHENLKGELDKFIPEIYVKLGLQNDSLRSAKSIFKYKKVRGIKELTFLYSEGAMGIISGLLNDPDNLVRSEAQIAYIRLNPDKPFRFLSVLTKAFSPWTQLSAFYLFRLYQLPVPSFADYLYSKHYTIRNFSLKMINYFQQLENISEVYKMLESKMELTRFLSYRAINDLRLYDSRLVLKNKFRDETNKNKIEIVRAFKNIGTNEDFDFLEIIIKSESDTLKTEACRSLYFMSPAGKERILNMNREANGKLDEFIAHITDPRN